MTHGTIFNIQRYALHDGPGIRTTIFFKGCPLACPWCHNPEGIAPQPVTRPAPSGPGGERIGRFVDVEELMAEIEKDQLYYEESGGGVTLSGGEPLAQPAFLTAVLEGCRRREIHTTLDTSGYAQPAVLEGALPLVDLVLFDLKLMDDERHRQATGVSNALIVENLGRVDAGGKPWRLRIPLIPGWTDDAENLEGIAALAASQKLLQGIDILPFHRIAAAKYRRLRLPDPMDGAAPVSPQHLAAAKACFESAGIDVTIQGES